MLSAERYWENTNQTNKQIITFIWSSFIWKKKRVKKIETIVILFIYFLSHTQNIDTQGV